jgi:hypothetical protein
MGGGTPVGMRLAFHSKEAMPAAGDVRRASFSQSADSPQYVLTTKWTVGGE